MADYDKVPDGAAMGRNSLVRAIRRPAAALLRRWRRWRYAPRLQIMTSLASVLAEDPVITVAGYPGRFAISPKSDILRRVLVSGTYEPALAQLCREHVDAGRDAIDVGANIGLYSMLLADLVRGGRVLAVEPTPGALRRLRRNIAMNGRDDRVVVFPGAAAAASSTVSIAIVPGREEYSTAGALVHPSVGGAAFETVEVAAQTIDSLVSTFALNPGFVKIDVEGMEHTVLAGMRSTMENFQPVILAECSEPLLRRNGSSAREIMREITRFGYLISDPLVPGAAPGTRAYGDILCIPWKGQQ